MNNLKLTIFKGISSVFQKFTEKIPNRYACTNLMFKVMFRNTIGQTYFKFRYLNTFNIGLNGQVYKNSIDYYMKNPSPLNFPESKYQELFEIADKVKFLSASLIQIDINELNTVDSFKEGYPYTGPYAKIQKILKFKNIYLQNEPDYFKEEIEKCFEKLENYVSVYETLFLLSSFSEELKVFYARIQNIKQKESLFNLIAKNNTDVRYSLDEELLLHIENYKMIKEELKEYPLWSQKFEEDINKQLAVINMKYPHNEIFEIIDQQKSFK